MSKPELKPCPFCGCIEIDDELNMICFECDTIGPQAKTRADAIKSWNTRAESAKDMEIDALRTSLEGMEGARNQWRDVIIEVCDLFEDDYPDVVDRVKGLLADRDRRKTELENLKEKIND